MPHFAIVLKHSAAADLDRLRKYDAALVVDGIERFLTANPTQVSKSRIRRLKGIVDPDYRLRLGEFRVFYNVDPAARRVDVLRIMYKDQTHRYYREVEK